MQQTMERRRPLGVTIFSVILAIQGIFELLLGVLAIVAIFSIGHAITTHGHTTTGTIVDVIGGVLGGISLVIGLLTLIFAIGLWMLKRWAFWLTVIVEVISLARHAFEFVQPHPNVGGIVTSMIIPAIILIYFFVDTNVRAAFRI